MEEAEGRGSHRRQAPATPLPAMPWTQPSRPLPQQGRLARPPAAHASGARGAGPAAPYARWPRGRSAHPLQAQRQAGGGGAATPPQPPGAMISAPHCLHHRRQDDPASSPGRAGSHEGEQGKASRSIAPARQPTRIQGGARCDTSRCLRCPVIGATAVTHCSSRRCRSEGPSPGLGQTWGRSGCPTANPSTLLLPLCSASCCITRRVRRRAEEPSSGVPPSPQREGSSGASPPCPHGPTRYSRGGGGNAPGPG